jgi:hypothetical protein
MLRIGFPYLLVSKFGYLILLLVRMLVGEIEEWKLVVRMFVDNTGGR